MATPFGSWLCVQATSRSFRRRLGSAQSGSMASNALRNFFLSVSLSLPLIFLRLIASVIAEDYPFGRWSPRRGNRASGPRRRCRRRSLLLLLSGPCGGRVRRGGARSGLLGRWVGRCCAWTSRNWQTSGPVREVAFIISDVLATHLFSLDCGHGKTRWVSQVLKELTHEWLYCVCRKLKHEIFILEDHANLAPEVGIRQQAPQSS